MAKVPYAHTKVLKSSDQGLKGTKRDKEAHGQYTHMVQIATNRSTNIWHIQTDKGFEHRLENSVVKHHSSKTKNPQVK